MSDIDTTTVIRGTVIEVGASDNFEGRAFLRLARNEGEVFFAGLTHDEARAIASSYFGEVITVTITRSDK
jgi:hypothetical protein